MKILFLGTPEFACPTLKKLHSDHDVVGVICQPDRARGRSKKPLAPPVKVLAESLGLAIFQPERLRKDPDLLEKIKTELKPDLLVVVAYGQILSQAWLDAAPLGALNVHASLLPALRGAAPIQWSVALGQMVTGVTIMQMELGLDSGPMLATRELEIDPTITGADLSPLLSHAGGDLLLSLLNQEPTSWKPIPQDETKVTWAPLLSRDHGRADLNAPAQELYNLWRGFQPWPGLWCFRGDKTFKLLDISPRPGSWPYAPGTLLAEKDQWTLVCGQESALALNRVQEQGRKPMAAGDYFRGRPPQPNERLVS